MFYNRSLYVWFEWYPTETSPTIVFPNHYPELLLRRRMCHPGSQWSNKILSHFMVLVKKGRTSTPPLSFLNFPPIVFR